MISKQEILDKFELFSGEKDGIEHWINPNDTPEKIFNRLSEIDNKPLSKEELNQLLILSHEAGVSDGFFEYYWLNAPFHPYDVTSIPEYQKKWINYSKINNSKIHSLDHLYWGFYRLYVDSLLFYGNIRTGYRDLRTKTEKELGDFFESKRFSTTKMKNRGQTLRLNPIPKDKRYFISEMAYKSFDSGKKSELKQALTDAWNYHKRRGGRKTTIGKLLDECKEKKGEKYKDKYNHLKSLAYEILDHGIREYQDIETEYALVAKSFSEARDAALQNTDYYLSMVDDLDIYIATSMRDRQDFRKMVDTCEKIFSNKRLNKLHLRYFDPTLSATNGHEDKGLIECLMVKAAKVLVYCADQKDSYGKDAEAAMALSLGKPVIFLCNEETRKLFLRDIHPLSRLIDFKSGVAVGAIVTSSTEEVVELLCRIFRNKMEYKLERDEKGYLRLREGLTGSVVRLQTNNKLLSETFWNYYNEQHTNHLPLVNGIHA